MNNNSPKHKLAVIGFSLSAISILFSIILLSVTSQRYYSENQASLFMVLSMYTSLPGIICSAIAKYKKNTEIFSILGIVVGIVSAILIIGAIASGIE